MIPKLIIRLKRVNEMIVSHIQMEKGEFSVTGDKTPGPLYAFTQRVTYSHSLVWPSRDV